MTMWNTSPDAFVARLEGLGLRRAYLLTSDGTLEASHPDLEPLAALVADEARDYDRHQACFFEVGTESGHLLAAFIHRTDRGQAAGGVRFWHYASLEAVIRDGLRLSRAMGRKSALAGLWWGGGKGVIARREGVDHHDPEHRAAIFRDYGRFIAGLAGIYVTAEDVGTTPEDMAEIFGRTRFITSIPAACGGSGNPSVLTARGVVVGMEAALAHLDAGTLAGKTVAMQGLGNVSGYMIGELLAREVNRIIGTDIEPRCLEGVKARFPDAPLALRLAAADDHGILAEAVDIVAPNAIGATLNPHTIPTIRAPIICGAANNQLAETVRDGRALAARQVLYVPDFLANRMGIVNCANEQYGSFAGDPAIDAHLQRETAFGIYQRSLEVFRRAATSGRSTAEEAAALADELARELHPIWPQRGQQIIDHLAASGWSMATSGA